MNEITFTILKIAITVCSVLVTYYLIPYIKTLTKKSEYAEIFQMIEDAVNAAEQTIKESGQGKAKKAQVIAYATAWLNERGIKITEEQLSTLIEAAVFNIQ